MQFERKNLQLSNKISQLPEDSEHVLVRRDQWAVLNSYLLGLEEQLCPSTAQSQ